jgi:DNA-binding beta-propeller fold protein YncE
MRCSRRTVLAPASRPKGSRRFQTCMVCIALWSVFPGAAGAASPTDVAPATRLRLESVVTLAARDFIQPVAIAAGPLGRLFIADVGRGTVLRVGADGQVLYEFESQPNVAALQPVDLEVTGFRVYVLDAQSNALLRFGDEGGFLDVLHSFRADGVETPRAIAVDQLGRVLIAQTSRHQVRLFDASQGNETVVGGFGSRPGELSRPLGVAFAPDGSFYVADTGNARLQRFSAVGNFAGAFSDSIGEPRGIAVGPTGELFVVDARRRSVWLRGPAGGVRDELRLGPQRPLDVTVVGDTEWVLEGSPPALARLRVERAADERK